MSTTYQGSGTTGQTPGDTPPTSAAGPILTLPADGDPLNAASVAQAFKENADYADFLRQYSRGSLLVQSDFSIKDDFCGNSVDAGLWITSTTGGGSGVSIETSATDTAGNTGSGAVSLLSVSGGSASIQTRPMTFSANDFELGGIMYVASDSGIYQFQLGFEAYFGFQASNLNANWQVLVNNSAHTTTVAVGTVFQNFVVKRSSGVLNAYINGALVYGPVSNSTNNDGLPFLLSASGAMQVIIDYTYLYVNFPVNGPR